MTLQEEKNVKHYETIIHRLKLLSKSQTAFLKKYLQQKIEDAVSIVTEGIELMKENGVKNSKVSELKKSLAILKLDELDVDVSSHQIMMREEMDILRKNIDDMINGVSGNSSNLSTNDIGTRTQALENENSNLRELLKEAQSALLTKSNSENNLSAMPPTPPSGNSDSSAQLLSQVSSLQAELLKKDKDYKQKEKEFQKEKEKEFQTQSASFENQNKDKDLKIKNLQSDLSKLLAAHEADDSVRVLSVENTKLKTQVATLEKDIIKMKQDFEKVLQSKISEMNKTADKRVSEVEKRLEAEKEEMMDAMAQEVEDIEKTKNAEKDVLIGEKQKLEANYNKLLKSRAGLVTGLKAANSKISQLTVQFKSMKNTLKTDLTEFKGSLKSQMGAMLLSKLKDTADQMVIMSQRYRKEMAERKKLHNILQELKGNIRVYVRCRPPSSKEIEQYGSEAQCVTFPSPTEVRLVNDKSREKNWEFDEVFGFDCSQEQIYAEVAGLVVSVLDGYNVCIFAYGQTGSGKTFTMSGPPDNRGVNTRALGDLFDKTQARAAENRDTISVSVLEVYNEDIRDLLVEGGGDNLGVRQGEHGNHVPGLTSLNVTSMQNVLDLLVVADKNRSSKATNMNEHSSRSHMMLTVTVVNENLISGVVSRGKLNLVDLAGSERLKSSGATGQALKEAQNINKSLSALGDVIQARATKQGHVPFRNSTLTFLLQDSLSQDSKTLMLLCTSPIQPSAEETTCSLNFAARVRSVELGKAEKNTTAAKPLPTAAAVAKVASSISSRKK